MPAILTSQKSNCKNCYKCIRHCPVKSIRFSGNQANIMEDECILCGECYTTCPQDAKVILDGTEIAKVLINENENVILSVAPSFTAYFQGGTVASLRQAAKKLGFADVQETAKGATLVTRKYNEMVKNKSQDVIISSCCHSVNLLIQKYYPQALPYLAKVSSPMQAHAAMLKEEQPDAKVVFVGPCISKKAEAEIMPKVVDCVLTFDELAKWMEVENVTLEKVSQDDTPGVARFYPTGGGILKTMDTSDEEYNFLAVDGMQNCINALEDIIAGNLQNCFVEFSACAGSCSGGPVMGKTAPSPVQNYISVKNYVGKEEFAVEDLPEGSLDKNHPYLGASSPKPGSSQIEEILRKMGKNTPDDELNCGSCGYNTCREKAVAIFQGKANYNMCLPFLKDKAESFSDNIIGNTPNGIIVLNESLEVQQINKSALRILQIADESHVMGEPVIRILDPTIFAETLESGTEVINDRVYLAEYKKYVEQTVLYDKSYHILICIMRDITEDAVNKEAKEKISRKTIETANQVVEKQMRAVQEIASLLGETTAETKIALTRLKESLTDE